MKVYVPSYITFDTISTDITVEMTDPTNDSGTANLTCTEVVPDGNDYTCSSTTGGTDENGGLCWAQIAGTPTAPTSLWDAGKCAGPNACCYTYNPSTRILSVGYSDDLWQDPNNYGKFDMFLTLSGWNPIGTLGGEQWYTSNTTRFPTTPLVDDASAIAGRRGATPGNALYYLEKLAKFEYLGIPQMT